MNPQIERLESLLQRVQRNAAQLAAARAKGHSGEQAELEAADNAEAEETAVRQSAPRLELTLTESVLPEVEPLAAVSPQAAVPPQPPALEPWQQEPPLSLEASLDDSAVGYDEEVVELEAQGSTAYAAPAQQAVEFDDSDELETAPPPPMEAEARTPPPESGPQFTPPGFEEGPLAQGPSIEQLGSTIDLEPGEPGEFDVETVDEESEFAPPAADEFEEPLPVTESASTYVESLAPPDNAREELEAIDRAERERETRLSALPRAAHLPIETLAQAPPPVSDASPGVITRSPIPDKTVPASYEGGRPQHEQNFLALLDDSLSLGRN